MAMQIFGAGVGRTGTYSLKLAIDQLDLGPCHHMEAVIHNMPVQVPLWSTALAGRADWAAIYDGFNSAVDWPTAAFFRELVAEYPTAKFVLTRRDPQDWADSFGETIYKLLAGKDHAPPHMQDWLAMAGDVLAKSGFVAGMDRDALINGFIAHNAAVKSTIPASQLLVYEVKEGWAPLCAFLGAPVPADPFPRTNSRIEFWDLVKAG